MSAAVATGAVEVGVPTWQMGRDRFQALKGIKRPFMMEISLVQLGRMGKRTRKAYDEQRAREWDASAKCAVDYARECCEAYMADPSILDDARIHQEAKEAIRSAIVRFEKHTAERRFDDALDANRNIGAVKAGDRVWALLGGRYIKVTKVFKASLRGIGETDGREYKVAIKACQREGAFGCWCWILHETHWPWWDGETEGAADTRESAMQLAEGAVRRRFERALAALDHAVFEAAEGPRIR